MGLRMDRSALRQRGSVEVKAQDAASKGPEDNTLINSLGEGLTSMDMSQTWWPDHQTLLPIMIKTERAIDNRSARKASASSKPGAFVMKKREYKRAVTINMPREGRMVLRM